MSDLIDEEGHLKQLEPIHMSRKQRRRKVKNRDFTKKGFTRVVRRDDNGQVHNIPTRKGSRIHNLAKHNVKKIRRAKKRAAKIDKVLQDSPNT